MKKVILSIFFILTSPQLFAEPSPAKIAAVYSSLDPRSLSQHLAFYELYPGTPEGKRALQDAWNLLSSSMHSQQNSMAPLPVLPNTIEALLSVVNKQPDQQTLRLDPRELDAIEKIAQTLPNRKLKGHYVKTEEEVLSLTSEEVDLARGLLLSQLSSTPDNLDLIRSYEASLDLMAMQILTRIPLTAPPKAKIRALNAFIFEEMGYRFPPHSLYAKDIDLYTFLPSVLDSRHGVCLGVSILYICLAQRLDLPLEMITPPGHIYVRYREGDTVINIETTARGIHLDSDEYLGIETRSLQQRNVKDVIGLAHYNHAAVHWHQKEYEKALTAYEKALPYLPDDLLLKELMAYNYLFVGNRKKGEEFLALVKDHVPDHAITKQNMAEDYLNGAVDEEGIKAMFMQVDEKRESILEKKMALEKAIEKHPRFRSGLFSLAVAWLQLHRASEALAILENYHRLDPNDPTAEYYLATLYAERLDYNKAWEHLRQAEQLVKARKHEPKALKELRKELSHLSPE
jgi:regulator of sirC expression with transglutaminase-like and TPR domain